MKIGLLRHFRVENRAPKLCNSEEYNQACSHYDNCEISAESMTIASDHYSLCYSSSKKRALETARRVFAKEIIVADELVEVPTRAIFKTRIRVPFALWNIINRFGWLLNLKRLPETRKQTRQRAARFISRILKPNPKEQNILLVSHGFFMLALQGELLKRGFKGERIITAKHGKIYEFTLKTPSS